MSSSGIVNVQWNREWFFSRRVKFDSGFNVMAVHEASWHGPEVVHNFTGIRKWVVKLWKRPFCFSKKVNVTLSSNWSRPSKVDVLSSWSPPGVLIRPSAIGKIILLLWGNITSFRSKSFRVDFRCVHRFQLLKACDQYVTFPNSGMVVKSQLRVEFPGGNWTSNFAPTIYSLLFGRNPNFKLRPQTLKFSFRAETKLQTSPVNF